MIGRQIANWLENPKCAGKPNTEFWRWFQYNGLGWAAKNARREMAKPKGKISLKQWADAAKGGSDV